MQLKERAQMFIHATFFGEASFELILDIEEVPKFCMGKFILKKSKSKLSKNKRGSV